MKKAPAGAFFLVVDTQPYAAGRRARRAARAATAPQATPG